MSPGLEIGLESWSRSTRQLAYSARAGELRFAASFWWQGVDLKQLERRFGRRAMERIYFHVIAFDLMRLVSLAPARLDFGPLARHATAGFVELWSAVVEGVWAQWRYEHGRPGYRGPEIAPAAGPAPPPIATRAPAEGAGASPRALVFCGGGKDSLVALALFEELGEEVDSFAYAASAYGDPAAQHRLVDRLLDHLPDRWAPRRRYRAWVLDDFLASPVVELEPDLGVGGLTAAETPASLFLALPVALAAGHRELVLAHERGADSPNLVWEATGEPVNHQWGKSLAAERLLAGYLDRLVEGLDYYSLLKPLADPVIFGALPACGDAVLATHSCNLAKPWCGRCPKCAYVGVGYAAFLPAELARQALGFDPLAGDERLAWHRRLLGVDGHTPFECVGQPAETRALFELCRRRGLTGPAMALYREAFPGPPPAAELDGLFTVRGWPHRLPRRLAQPALAVMERWAAAARRCFAES